MHDLNLVRKNISFFLFQFMNLFNWIPWHCSNYRKLQSFWILEQKFITLLLVYQIYIFRLQITVWRMILTKLIFLFLKFFYKIIFNFLGIFPFKIQSSFQIISWIFWSKLASSWLLTSFIFSLWLTVQYLRNLGWLSNFLIIMLQF